MAAEECLQEPTAFQEVSVSLTEEKEFTLDPYLFGLSGNDIHQYCTMLSLLELENSKAEMFLETPQGISTPLSLVQVAEEFEVLQGLYPGGDGTTQTKMQEPLLQGSGAVPLVQLQYDYAPVLEGGVLQGNPPGSLIASELLQGTETRISKLVSTGENFSKSPEPLEGQPAWKGLMGDFSATVPQQQEGFPQPITMCFLISEQNGGIVPQGSEQSHPQDVWRSDKLLEESSWKEGHHGDHSTGEAFVRIGEESCPSGNFQESVLNDSLHSQVYEEIQTSVVSELCPTCGRTLELNLNPTAFQLSPSEKASFGCPDCGRSFGCSTAVLTESQINPAEEWDKLLRQLDFGHHPHQKDVQLEKPFKCLDCGKGFVHRSSIPRHQRRHRKENSSPLPGQEGSPSLGLKPLYHPKPPSRKKKPFHHSASGTGQVNGNAKEPGDLHSQCASNLSSVCVQSHSLASEPCKKQAGMEKPFCCSECGKRFVCKSTMMRHHMLHQEERPFKCLHCDKSYIQKSHLKRHDQIKHSNHLFQREAL